MPTPQQLTDWFNYMKPIVCLVTRTMLMLSICSTIIRFVGSSWILNDWKNLNAGLVCLQKLQGIPIARIHSTPCAKNFGDIFHMDVWGPASVRTVDHCIYTLMVIDEATDWLEEPLMKSKDESFAQYVILQTGLQTQYSTMVKILHSD